MVPALQRRAASRALEQTLGCVWRAACPSCHSENSRPVLPAASQLLQCPAAQVLSCRRSAKPGAWVLSRRPPTCCPPNASGAASAPAHRTHCAAHWLIHCPVHTSRRPEEGSRQPMAQPRCKIVVRHLPPALQVRGVSGSDDGCRSDAGSVARGLQARPRALASPLRSLRTSPRQEDAFKETLGEWVDRADWFRYVQGKARCAAARRPPPAGAACEQRPACSGCWQTRSHPPQRLPTAAPRSWCTRAPTCACATPPTCRASARPGPATPLCRSAARSSGARSRPWCLAEAGGQRAGKRQGRLSAAQAAGSGAAATPPSQQQCQPTCPACCPLSTS